MASLLSQRGTKRSLHDCEKDKVELRDRLSALETELVVVRKLLPGGEWYLKLGLDRDQV